VSNSAVDSVDEGLITDQTERRGAPHIFIVTIEPVVDADGLKDLGDARRELAIGTSVRKEHTLGVR
jgi:hypothetical protein